MSNVYWPLYEVSCVANRAYHTAMLAVLHAADERMALENAVMLTPVVAKDVQFGW